MKIPLETYRELTEYLEQFNKGLYEIMIIEGKQGIGKSSIVKQSFYHLDPTTDYLWLEGRTSAAAFYKALYKYVDCTIILDDTDDFLTDKQCTNLLKTLCQTDSTKRVQWLTMRLPNDLPGFFYTSSRVIMLTNETRKSNVHLKAIQDRGLHILFKPTKQEIHQYARKFCNTEVYSFIERFLPSIEDLTLRIYTTAQKAHDIGLPYQKTLLLSWELDPLVKTFLEIEIESPHLDRQQKKELFLQTTSKTERTYERVLNQLQQSLQTQPKKESINPNNGPIGHTSTETKEGKSTSPEREKARKQPRS